MKNIIFVFILLFCLCSYAQEQTDETNNYITCYDSLMRSTGFIYDSERFDCIEINITKALFTTFDFEQEIEDEEHIFFFQDYRVKCERKNIIKGQKCESFFNQKRNKP